MTHDWKVMEHTFFRPPKKGLYAVIVPFFFFLSHNGIYEGSQIMFLQNFLCTVSVIVHQSIYYIHYLILYNKGRVPKLNSAKVWPLTIEGGGSWWGGGAWPSTADI